MAGKVARAWGTVRPRLRKAGYAAAALSVAGGLLVLVVAIVVTLMNDEYRAGVVERVTLDAFYPRPGGQAPVTLRVTLHEFDEPGGRVRASLFAYTRDPAWQSRLQHDSLHLYAMVSDGMETGGVGDLVRHRLVFAPDTIPNSAFGEAKSQVLEFSPTFSRDVAIFPLDTYRVRLLVMLTTREEHTPAFEVEVQKSYVGRTFSVDGTSTEVMVAADRLLLDRIVVISASILFLALCGVIGRSLWMERDRLSGFNESIALAGFLLSAMGFREFAGFDQLPSRSVLDVLLFIPALTVLLTAFFLGGRTRREHEPAKGEAEEL
jgi:hypothetical protein